MSTEKVSTDPNPCADEAMLEPLSDIEFVQAVRTRLTALVRSNDEYNEVDPGSPKAHQLLEEMKTRATEARTAITERLDHLVERHFNRNGFMMQLSAALKDPPNASNHIQIFIDELEKIEGVIAQKQRRISEDLGRSLNGFLSAISTNYHFRKKAKVTVGREETIEKLAETLTEVGNQLSAPGAENYRKRVESLPESKAKELYRLALCGERAILEERFGRINRMSAEDQIVVWKSFDDARDRILPMEELCMRGEKYEVPPLPSALLHRTPAEGTPPTQGEPAAADDTPSAANSDWSKPMTKKEIAAAFRVCEKTIQRWEDAGELNLRRQGKGRWRFDVTVLGEENLRNKYRDTGHN